MTNELIELITSRCTIRKFKADPIPKEDILTVLEAARRAPSGSNQQPWHFIVVTDKKIIAEMKRTLEARIADIKNRINSPKAAVGFDEYTRYFTFFDKAPALICPLVKPYDSLLERILQKYELPETLKEQETFDPALMSVSAAIENLLLAAHALGYGTCWMTGPLLAQKDLEKILKVEAPWHLAAIIPVGKPDEKLIKRPRKDIGEITTFIE
jgi:nitroreductase